MAPSARTIALFSEPDAKTSANEKAEQVNKTGVMSLRKGFIFTGTGLNMDQELSYSIKQSLKMKMFSLGKQRNVHALPFF
ncbi:hypothetical protein GCM10011325_21720 [Dyadobacter sediminis]|nr:hypothetical protein GCM10011325_21720 [Dyadobacter sediminis]